MNNERNLKQLEKVIKALTQQKKAECDAIAKINGYIGKKQQFILKIKQYRQDYDSVNGLRLSHQQPALMINMNHFLVKMQQSIVSEEKAINMAIKDRERIATKLAKVEQKIKAMENLLGKKQRHRQIGAENAYADEENEMSIYHR